MGMAEFGMAVVSAGFGYIAADGLDRFLATYNPASTEAKPKDKFTSEGAGTLANTLNVASPPGFMRIGAGVGLAAVPAVASYYVDGKFIKSSLQGLALGSGVNLFKTLWNNVLMPMLKPKDTSAASFRSRTSRGSTQLRSLLRSTVSRSRPRSRAPARPVRYPTLPTRRALVSRLMWDRLRSRGRSIPTPRKLFAPLPPLPARQARPATTIPPYKTWRGLAEPEITPPPLKP
ncbi:hypothetical protein LCGC14_1978550 [marine sediment metagenome]|uniref:Uncharacterized protein n=1 Tax=marine sediment metagenome TaxID=412755 RepID=A0A0F9FXU1_9ZZZZ